MLIPSTIPFMAAHTAPDYQGGSIVNLMSSILHAHGGQATAPPLTGLAPETVGERDECGAAGD